MLRRDKGRVALERDLKNNGNGVRVPDLDKDLSFFETKIHELEQIDILKQKKRIGKVISILHNNLAFLFWIFNDDDIISTFLRECSDLKPEVTLFGLSLPAEFMLFRWFQLKKKALAGLEGLNVFCGF